METRNNGIIILLILFYNIFSPNLYSKQFIKINEEVIINKCEDFSGNNNYTWEFLEIPKNSDLNTAQTNNDCIFSFVPDKKGDYKIKFTTYNYEEIFDYTALNNLKRQKITLYYYNENNFYYDDLEYYEDYEENELDFQADKPMFKLNFSIKGIAKITDLLNQKTYIFNTDKDIYIKFDRLCKINFFPQDFTPEEFFINTFDFDISSITMDECNRYLSVKIKNSSNKTVNGVLTAYLENDNLYSVYINSTQRKLNLCLNPQKIIFTPLKKEYPLKNLTFNTIEEDEIEINYPQITYHRLNIRIAEELKNQNILLNIKSLEEEHCISDKPNIICSYEQSLTLTDNTALYLPEGNYKITVYKKGFQILTRDMEIDESLSFYINNLEEKEKIPLLILNNAYAINFSDKYNNNYFFQIDSINNIISIPKGKYTVRVFTSHGIYEKTLDILNERNIEFEFINFKVKVIKDGKILHGGIIFDDNSNYVFNDGNNINFYIEKNK